MRQFITYNVPLAAGFGTPPDHRGTPWGVSVSDELLTGDFEHDACHILGHAWRRVNMRWDAAAEQYTLHEFELDGETLRFKVRCRGQPSHWMWIDGYQLKGPW